MTKLEAGERVALRRTPKSTARGDRSKTAILDAAMTLFARDGYGASVAAIAEAANLTLPGLLHHYRSKEELFVAVLEERDRRANEALDGTLEHGSRTYLHSLEAVVANNASSPGMVKLFVVAVGEAAVSEEHPGHEHFAERYRHITARIRTELELMQGSGVLEPDADCELMARLVVAMMDGLQVQWLLDE